MTGDDGATRHLLLDSRLIERTENTRLVLGAVEKDRRNPLLVEELSWEVRFDNLYPNIVHNAEKGRFECWYSPFIVDTGYDQVPPDQRDSVPYPGGRDSTREMGVCYATSEDGLHWIKPSLGLVEFGGSCDNNIVLREAHGAGVFRDDGDPDPERRYKMLFKGEEISVSFSPDGRRWSEPLACPEGDARGDTHNNALWAPTLERYVGFTRTWGGQPAVRQVARITSVDFQRWSSAEVVLEGLEANLQVYAMPVFFYGGVYLGLPVIHDQTTDQVWTELAWSPDTRTWERVSPGTPLIPNAEEEGAYDWGCVYPAACPVFLDDEILLYYGGGDGLHMSWRRTGLCLARLRLDGFAGYTSEIEDQRATIETVPMPWTGGRLWVAADVVAGGSVTVSIEREGKLVGRGQLVHPSTPEAEVAWVAGIDVGGKIALRFELCRATLYSFGFG